jgi:hypothetical protein
MGFLSKVWKGVKKTFKKIGKGIKKGFKAFGKFMGKIGIVGQIAMMFLTGGIGNAMMSTFGSVLKGLGAVAQGGGAFAGIAGAAQTVLGAAGNFARLVAKPFTTVTDAVTSFIGNTSKYLANKIPGMANFVAKLPGNMTLADAPDTFFGLGEGSVIGNVGKGIADNVAGFANIGKDLVSGDLGSFGVKAPPLASVSSEVGTLGEYNPQTGGFEYEGQTLEAKTESLLDKPAVSDVTLNKTPATEVGFYQATPEELAFQNKKGFFATAKDNLVDNLRPTKIAGRMIDGVGQGVTDMGTQAVFNAAGLGPEAPRYEEQSTNFAREFAATDYTGAVASGLTPSDDLRYADFTQRANYGDPMGSFNTQSTHSRWLQRNLQQAG